MKVVRMTHEQADRVYQVIAAQWGFTTRQIGQLRNSPLDPNIRTACVRNDFARARTLIDEVLSGADR